MKKSETIPQRISDWKGFCKSRGLTYKQVCDEAGIDYDSVKSNMRTALQGADTISIERMNILEQAAIDLAEQKVETTTA